MKQGANLPRVIKLGLGRVWTGVPLEASGGHLLNCATKILIEDLCRVEGVGWVYHQASPHKGPACTSGQGCLHAGPVNFQADKQRYICYTSMI